MHNKHLLSSIGLFSLILFLVIKILAQPINRKEQVVFEDLKASLEDSQHIFIKNSDSLLLDLHDAILMRPDEQPIEETAKYIQTIRKEVINEIDKDDLILKEEVTFLWKKFQTQCLDTMTSLSKKMPIIRDEEIGELKKYLQKDSLTLYLDNNHLRKATLKSKIIQNSVVFQNYLSSKIGGTIIGGWMITPEMTHLKNIPIDKSISSEIFLRDDVLKNFPKFLWQEINGQPVTLRKEYDYYKYQVPLPRTGEPTFEIKHYWENRSVVNHQWQIDTILVQDTFKFYAR